jgi:hypothetical protein
MIGSRRIEAEWLDLLPADDPRAIRSRRDLRRVNLFMLQAGIMRRLLMRHAADMKPRTLLELGCGDGAFMLRLARGLAPHWPDVTVTLLDRQDIVTEEIAAGFRALGWQAKTVTADVFAFLERGMSAKADIVTCNLFIHHFTDPQLVRLFGRLAEFATLFVACEPQRSSFARAGCRLLWAIGCNDVSRHDAAASVRAGFSGHELSALWPKGQGWRLVEGEAWPFSHTFVARRTAAASS